MESKTLRSHRVVGAIADEAARCVSFYELGGVGFVCARVSQDAFQVLKLETLGVQLTSPRLGRPIECLVCCGEWTFCGVGAELWCFERAGFRGVAGSHAGVVASLDRAGSLVVACAPRVDGRTELTCWSRPAAAAPRSLPVVGARLVLDEGFRDCVVCHPPTYVNKVLVGSGDGRLALWNVRTGKRVHAFAYASEDVGGVTCLAASGALDVVAVGRTRGRVEMVDVKRDRLLFFVDHGAAATCLCFCSGGEAPETGKRCSLLTTGGADGALRVWDLAGRRLAAAERAAHGGRGLVALFAGGVGSAGVKGGGVCGPQAIVVTSLGGDNGARQWSLDAADAAPRLVRSRVGHEAAPTAALWYGPPACGGAVASRDGDAYGTLQLLSASRGDRSLRCVHAARDVLNGELSQGKGVGVRAKKMRLSDPHALKLPPIVAVAACDAKDGAYPNVVTCHEGERVARVWHLADRRLGDVCLTQPHWGGRGSDDPGHVASKRNEAALSCCLSQCGNFAVVGHADGYARKYNVQSGDARGTYPPSLEAAAEVAKHAASVAVPGAVARAARDIDRKMRKGERVDAATKHGAKKTADQLRTAGAAGGRAHKRNDARRLKHAGPVTGVSCDGRNDCVVTAGTDGWLKWWDFKDHHARGKVDAGAPVSVVAAARASNLLAVATDGGVVILVDGRAPEDGGGRVLRRFATAVFRAPRSVAWAPSLQSLYAVDGDGALSRFDVPSGHCVDRLAFPGNEATSVSVNPTGEFVSTTHVGDRAIALWTDKAAYQRVDAVALDPAAGPPKALSALTPEDLLADLPAANAAAALERPPPENALVALEASDAADDGAAFAAAASVPLAAHVEALNADRGALKLSGLPRVRTETLHALDAISERNRPVAPPKKPEQAPFFLPSAMAPDAPMDVDDAAALPAPPPEFDECDDGDDGDDAADDDAAVVVVRPDDADDAAARCRLAALALGADAGPLVDHLNALHASGVDAEIAQLCRGTHDVPGLSLVERVADHLAAALEAHADFDALQAYIHRLLQHHASPLSLPQLKPAVERLAKAQKAAAARFRALVHENLCLLEHASSLT